MGDRPRTDGSGLHCPHCGTETTADHSYCINCGGDLSALHEVTAADHDLPERDGQTDSDRTGSGPSATNRAGSGRRATDRTEGGQTDPRVAFRKRVRYLVGNGWDIEYDAGSEVVLADRGIGSIGVHILLLMFTGGLGNLLYGWYRYSVTPTKVLLRATETDPGYEVVDPSEGGTAVETDGESTGSLSRFAYGLGSLVVGILLILTTGFELAPSLFGGLFVLLSFFLIPPIRRRIENRHPPTTFGSTESVEERYVTDTDHPCTVCGDRVEDGLVRDYKREQVFAGIPLYTMENGENHYCAECNSDRAELPTGYGAPQEVSEPPSGEFDDIDRELAQLREDSTGSDTATADTDAEKDRADERV
jgi:hypothetical protein